MIKLEKNVTSVLAISQKIQAIRTFLIPQLDFKFMNGQLKKKDVAFMYQKETHDSVNKLIGSRLPVGVHHGSWKDGCFSISSLQDKEEVILIRSAVHLSLSKYKRVKNMIEYSIEEEVNKHRNLEFSIHLKM